MDPTLLIILIFVVAPLIEKLLKAGKQEDKPPLPRQRPRPRMEGRAERDLPERGIEIRMPPAQREEQARRDAGPAADVLPDDLWEILTGERRSPLPTPPPPDSAYDEPDETAYGPEPAGAEFSHDDIESSDVLPVPARAESPSRPARGRSYDEMLPVRAPPRVVSMEPTSFDDSVRHRQFHDRLDNLPPRARVQRRRHPRAADFMTDADLRRAIIMTEILGPPRGLQQGD